MSELHSHNVFHGYLTLGSFIVDYERYESIYLNDITPLNDNLIRKNILYTSPEEFKNNDKSYIKKMSKEIDMWRIGVILYTYGFNIPPFPDSDSLYSYINNPSLRPPCSVNDTILNILNGLLNPNPSERYNCKQVLEIINDSLSRENKALPKHISFIVNENEVIDPNNQYISNRTSNHSSSKRHNKYSDDDEDDDDGSLSPNLLSSPFNSPEPKQKTPPVIKDRFQLKNDVTPTRNNNNSYYPNPNNISADNRVIHSFNKNPPTTPPTNNRKCERKDDTSPAPRSPAILSSPLIPKQKTPKLVARQMNPPIRRASAGSVPPQEPPPPPPLSSIPAVNIDNNNNNKVVTKVPTICKTPINIKNYDINKAEKHGDYYLLEEIGHGSYGIVYIGTNKMINDKLAIKRITCKRGVKQSDIINEVNIHAELSDSAYTVKFIDAFCENKDIFLVMGYCDNGDLKDLIKNYKKKGAFIEIEKTKSFTDSLLNGLAYIHDKSVIHRDVKPENLFLNSEENGLLLGDFGISKMIENENMLCRSVAGTPLYMAPELLENREYTNKVDSWSLGCVLYEMCSLEVPYQARNMQELLVKQKHNRKVLPNFVPNFLIDIIDKLLRYEDKYRYSVDQALIMFYSNCGK